MVELSFDLIIAAFAMIILNCRGYYKYAMGKQLSEREAARREFMLFPNLYKWVCICSSLLIIVAFTYYCIEGLTTNSFRFMSYYDSIFELSVTILYLYVFVLIMFT